MDEIQELLKIVDGIVTDDHEADREFRARADRIVARLKKVLISVSPDAPASGIEQQKLRLLKKDLSYENLLAEAAITASWMEILEHEVDAQKRQLIAERIMKSLLLAIIRRQLENQKISGVITDVAREVESTRRFLDGALQGRKSQKTLQGKNAVDARHSQPGGSRDKRQKVRDAWASGKYRSRDDCAEKEHKALGMAYSTARKALINTPDPT